MKQLRSTLHQAAVEAFGGGTLVVRTALHQAAVEASGVWMFMGCTLHRSAVEGSGGGWKTIVSGCATMVSDPAVYMQYLGMFVCFAK